MRKLQTDILELLNLINKNNNELTRLNKKLGLTVHALTIFKHLQTDEKLNQRKIAEIIGLTKATIGRELQALENKHYIKRTQCKIDSRQMNITITPTGIKKYQQALEQLNKLLENIDLKQTIIQSQNILKGLNK